MSVKGGWQRDVLSRTDAIIALQVLGRHLIILKHDGSPKYTGYLDQPASRAELKRILAHNPDARIGIQPGPDLVGLDVDYGDPNNIEAEHPPLCSVPSKTPGRRHIYYRSKFPYRSFIYELEGCTGHVRGDRGYLELHGNAPQALLTALSTTPPDQGFYPATSVRRASKQIIQNALQEHGERPGASSKDDSLAEQLLFDTTRHLVYPKERATIPADWLNMVVLTAAQVNKADKLNISPVRLTKTARNIAVWTWEHPNFRGGAYIQDHSPEAQSRRRIIGLGKLKRRLKPRNKRILQLHEAGLNQQEIATQEGVTQATVSRVLTRAKAAAEADRHARERAAQALKDTVQVWPTPDTTNPQDGENPHNQPPRPPGRHFHKVTTPEDTPQTPRGGIRLVHKISPSELVEPQETPAMESRPPPLPAEDVQEVPSEGLGWGETPLDELEGHSGAESYVSQAPVKPHEFQYSAWLVSLDFRRLRPRERKDLAVQLAADGHPDTFIAHKCGVARRTVRTWLKEARRRGVEIAPSGERRNYLVDKVCSCNSRQEEKQEWSAFYETYDVEKNDRRYPLEKRGPCPGVPMSYSQRQMGNYQYGAARKFYGKENREQRHKEG